MARFARDFLSSGFDFKANEQLLGFRFAFFNASMTFIALVLSLFALHRFASQSYIVGLIDLSYGAILLAAVWKLRQDKRLYDRVAQFVIVLTFISLVAATLVARESNILSWYILYVIMSFIMSGSRNGFKAYAASTITLLLFMAYLPEVYTPKTVLTLVSINSIITFMIFNYDRKVHHSHRRLDEINTLVIHREHETLHVLGRLAEYKDPQTGAHVARVSEYSKLLARASNLEEEMIETIYLAAPFHDIGKVGIPDKILLKDGQLNRDEFNIIKSHTTIGSEILKNTNSKYLRAGAEIAASHHEHWDGSGYPNGLAGETIPLFGRIVAIADVFDALTTARPYKEAWQFGRAMAYIKAQAGKQFDPGLAELFTQHEEWVLQIYRSYAK